MTSYVKWVSVAVVVITIGALMLLVFGAFEDRGAQRERASTIERNKEAGNAGENARLNLYECASRGLRFDYVTGKCER